MGMAYEVLTSITTSAAKLVRNFTAPPRREKRIAFGPDPNQAIVVFEPAHATHEAAVLYFHGGAYLVGTPQSMGIAADVFNAQGYRFISVGFGLLPHNRFPSQVDDAFAGVKAAMGYLDSHGPQGCPVVLGGNSAGGHAAMMVAYGRSLQESCGIDASRIAGVISVAGVPDLVGMAQAMDQAKLERLRQRYTTFSSASQAAPYSPLELVDGLVPRVPILCIHDIYDTISPYDAEKRFVDKLNAVTDMQLGEMLTLSDHRNQHIRLTAGVFTENPRTSEVQAAMFDWLARKGL